METMESGGKKVENPSLIYKSKNKSNKNISIQTIEANTKHRASIYKQAGVSEGQAWKLIQEDIFLYSPTPPEADVKAWVRDAWNKNAKISKADVDDFVERADGQFSINDVCLELGAREAVDRKRVSTYLSKAVSQEVVEKVRGSNSVFRKVNKAVECMDYLNADPRNTLEIAWPLGIHHHSVLFPKSIVIVAGGPNSGKTGFALEAATYNLHKLPVRYFTSEMAGEELRDRLDMLAMGPGYWERAYKDKRFLGYERSYDFHDVVEPDAFNIIDFLEMHDNFFEVSRYIKAVHDKLKNGIAMILLQKPQGSDKGYGGIKTIEKARLAITLEHEGGDYGTAQLIKVKKFPDPRMNPNGMKIPYRIVSGARFEERIAK